MGVAGNAGALLCCPWAAVQDLSSSVWRQWAVSGGVGGGTNAALPEAPDAELEGVTTAGQPLCRCDG